MSYQPLEGVRVLDLCRLLPGALATRKLADLGAEVVKVEQPGRGDYLRTIPPFIAGEGVMHLVLNRGKRSIVVDYHSPEGIVEIDALAMVADVVVESSRPGAMARMGVDLAGLRQRRPELVVCSVSGFGQTGPLAGLPSHGMNMDALAGAVTTTMVGGRTRLAAGTVTSIASELGGINAALAIVAALLRARATGEGAWVDASCWDAAVELNRFHLASLSTNGEPFLELGAIGPLYDVYLSSDAKPVFFCAIEEKFWADFCTRIDRPDLRALWRGGDAAVSFERDQHLSDELDAIFATATADEWAARFGAWGIPGSLILDDREVLASDHLRERALVDAGAAGSIARVDDPIRWVGDPHRPGHDAAPSPALGADGTWVRSRWLGEFGAA